MAAPAGTSGGKLTPGVGVPIRSNFMQQRLWFPPVVIRRTCLPAERETCSLTVVKVFQSPVFGTETVAASLPSTESLNDVPVVGLETLNVTS